MQRHEIRRQNPLRRHLLYQCGCDVDFGSRWSDSKREGSSYKTISISCSKDFSFVHFLGVGKSYFKITNGH